MFTIRDKKEAVDFYQGKWIKNSGDENLENGSFIYWIKHISMTVNIQKIFYKSYDLEIRGNF